MGPPNPAGHFAWQKGWGPQGQQEIWASDMFGFHPEADMHWSEAEGPEPLVGAAGLGRTLGSMESSTTRASTLESTVGWTVGVTVA